MKTMTFSGRTAKEILRDPTNLFFGLAFPLILLLLLSAIQANIPVSLFEIWNLTPGLSVFGLSFLTLFAGLLLARDRETAYLQRLYTTPLRPIHFILGYILPLVPIALCQTLICYLAALLLGLELKISILWAALLNLPAALFFVSLGLLCGSVMGSKAVGGICGALVTNLTAWLSGIWFDLSLVGGAFEKIANLLPFTHAVKLGQAAYAGTWDQILPHLWWVLAYGLITTVLALILFIRQMKKL